MDNNIIRILPSDKSLGPTVMTNTWYTKEVQRLLQGVKFSEGVDTIPFDNIQWNPA